MPDEQVLSDPTLDGRLRRDGFVVVPGVIDPAAAGEVRERYGELHGWSGEGFEPDLMNPDADYRHRTSDALAASLDEAVVPLFADHSPFLRNFLCKWPGADSELYLHRDWMYVDERVGLRSYVAWVALEDVCGHNGQLRVLRGSHRLDAMLRGTNLEAPWMAHEDVIRERLESVPIFAGDAVVFDNALVHCSYPNNSGTPRVVAAVGVRPTGAPLTYWRRSGPDAAELRIVDEEFFLTETPTALHAAAPGQPVIETSATHQVDLSPQQLAARLDQVGAVGSHPMQRLERWMSRRQHRRGRTRSTGRVDR